jgi:hypothetical protein
MSVKRVMARGLVEKGRSRQCVAPAKGATERYLRELAAAVKTLHKF